MMLLIVWPIEAEREGRGGPTELLTASTPRPLLTRNVVTHKVKPAAILQRASFDFLTLRPCRASRNASGRAGAFAFGAVCRLSG